jgi:hypothetical protein
MDVGDMTMLGQPTVVGTGNSGSITFAGSDTAFFRYSIGSEHGFMPQMLPGLSGNSAYA